MPPSTTSKRALTTARISSLRGRPPGLGGGSKSLIRSHSASVRSVGYGLAFIPTVHRTDATYGRLFKQPLRVHRRPHPGRRALQTLDGFLVADLAGFEVSQHRVQFIELELLQVEITQEIRGKGAELLGRFAQPLQHRGGSNLEDSSRGTDT